jgi:ligand-binding sensor domain-containing protein
LLAAVDCSTKIVITLDVPRGKPQMKINRFSSVVLVLVIVALSRSFSQAIHWEPTNGPNDGCITSIVRSSGRLFVGTGLRVLSSPGNGVYRSTNEGQSWERLSDGLPTTPVYQCCIEALEDGTLLLGAYPSKGLFRSTDNGDSWVRVDTDSSDNKFSYIVSDGKGYIYAAASVSLYRSMDKGISWTLVLRQSRATQSLVVDSLGNVYLGVYDYSIDFSSNHGDTWSGRNVQGEVRCMTVGSGGELLVGTQYGLQKSTDTGSHWQLLTTGPADNVIVARNGTIIVDMRYDGILQSTDVGEHWIAARQGMAAPPITAFLADVDGSVFAGTAGCALYRLSGPGAAWAHVPQVVPSNASVSTLAISPGGVIYGCGSSSTLFVSSDVGQSWIQPSRDLGYISAVGCNTDERVYASSNGALYRSSTCGSTWQVRSYTVIEPNTYLFTADGIMFGSVSGKGVRRSRDGGFTWDGGTGFSATSAQWLCRNSAGHLFAATHAHVFRSTDSGATWTRHYQGITSSDVSSVAVDSAGYVYASTWGRGVFRSSDNAETWTKVSSGRLDTLQINAMVVAPDNSVLLSTNDDGGSRCNGIYRTTDHGDSWGEANVGLGTLQVLTLAVDRRGLLYAGTKERGVYVASVAPVPVIVWPHDNASAIPTSLVLAWTRPYGATTFHLQLSTDSTFVSGLLNDQQGIPETVFPLTGLHNGTTYFWRVRVEGSEESYSATARFTTAIAPLPLPEAVTLVQPLQDSVVATDTLRLVWRKATPEVDKYWLEYSTDSTFASKINHPAMVDTTDVVRALEINATYFWRVRAHNSSDWGPVSETRRFRRIVTGVSMSGSMPTEFALYQNHPNPFNPTTTVGYSIGVVSGQWPVASTVKIVVVDLLGREVAVLVDEKKEPGRYEVKFDGRGMPSGVYFCQMKAGDVVQVRKLLLIR